MFSWSRLQTARHEFSAVMLKVESWALCAGGIIIFFRQPYRSWLILTFAVVGVWCRGVGAKWKHQTEAFWASPASSVDLMHPYFSPLCFRAIPRGWSLSRWGCLYSKGFLNCRSSLSAFLNNFKPDLPHPSVVEA